MNFRDRSKISIILQIGKKIGLGHYYRMMRLKAYFDDRFDISIFTYFDKDDTWPDFTNQTIPYCIDLTGDFLENLNDRDFLIIDIYNIDSLLNLKLKSCFKKKLIYFGANTSFADERTYVINVAEGKGPKTLFNNKNILEGIKFWVPDKSWSNIRSTYDLSNKSKKILAVFGGTDPSNLAKSLTNAIIHTNPKYSFDIIVPELKKINKITPKIIHIPKVESLINIFNKYEMVITSPGNIFFEAIYFGIPVIAITQSLKQMKDFTNYPNVYDDFFLTQLTEKLDYYIKVSKENLLELNIYAGEGISEIMSIFNN